MTGLALVLAVIVNSKLIKWRNAYRGFIFLPVLTSLVVASLVFTILFDPRNGFMTSLLSYISIQIPDFRTTRYLAIPAIAGITLWRWTGYVMVIQLAGLQTLPEAVLDAAKLDGAIGLKGLFYITIPLLRPVLIFTTILITIGVFNLFDEPFVLYGTKGGPGGAGLVLGTLVYRNAFEFFKLGYASSIAYVVAGLIFAASLIQLRFASPPDHT
ncbi:MAG: sugar ABC transporter permease [Anaerolineae bacterium]